MTRLFGAGSDAKPPRSESLFLWGPLEVKQPLGAGSFGEVFAAWDPTLARDVALKLRSPEVGALRWLDEARNLARVRHPHVLTVHGADVLDGRAGIWTELITGRTLEQELEISGPFPATETLRIGRDIASALVAVHAAGLVHGDIKASNIMLEDGESPRRAVLVDFGSADQLLGQDDIPPYLVGTPLTMAPEVLDGKPATSASDVYGLGATLFRLLTGRYPVETASLDDLKRAHASGEPRSARSVAPNVSPRLSRVLERALEPDPARRWPDARAFKRALDDVADPTRRIRARAAAIGASAAALAAIVVLGILIARPGPGPISR
ncbi:MAG TPA: serine/threonine-protein kinase, partial [Candidatus Krumholzibacteria bacterium]|nr:serine/threonine-protein kinase [Candidatus Krumholzibacteria bacterium]